MVGFSRSSILRFVIGLSVISPLLIASTARAQQSRKSSVSASTPDPVRPGDEVEVKSGSTWYPGTVVSYAEGRASVDYKWGSIETNREFAIADMRFPRGEGHWMIWSDASKRFKIEARYLTRSATHVTLLKADGSQIQVPIDQLAAPLKRQVEKTPLPGMENAVDGVNPVRIGDAVQFEYFREWTDAVVTDVLPGKVVLRYGDDKRPKTETFELAKVRFPDGEGHWRKWASDSGESAIIARYLSRTETDVRLRTDDGRDISVPISQLSSSIRRQLAETPITGKENLIDGVSPLRVDDRVEVKHWFDWRDGRVLRSFIGGAEVEFSYREKLETKEFKLDDIRFPDGEGRWRSWSDSSRKFDVIARFLFRNETHVTIRKEDGKTARVEIAMLNPKIRQLLDQTRIISPRPPLVRFDEPPGEINSATTQDFQTLVLSQPAIAPEQPLRQGGMKFPLLHGDSVSSAYPIGDTAQTVAVATFASSHFKEGNTQLYWANLIKQTAIAGPMFLPDERIVDYSPTQSRLITAQVQGWYDQPVRFCSYRVEVGKRSAAAELSWEIPKSKSTFGSGASYQIKLVGSDRLLFAFDKQLSLINFATRHVEYVIGNRKTNRFWVHPGGRHVASFDSESNLTLHEIDTGRTIAQQPGPKYGSMAAGYSQDGRYLVRAMSTTIDALNLTANEPAKTFRQGGLRVGDASTVTLMPGGWINVGDQIYSVGLELLVWKYVPVGISITHQEMIGRQLLAVATSRSLSQPEVHLGVATVPHPEAVELMAKVDPATLMMLKPGAPVRINGRGDARIIAGLRRAAAANQWIENPAAEVELVGWAGPGKAVTQKYERTSFSRFGGRTVEEHTTTPWEQHVQIIYDGQPAWETMAGGIPGFMMIRQDETIGQKLAEYSKPDYGIFDQVNLPAEMLYPRYNQGLGRTELTLDGFKDVVH